MNPIPDRTSQIWSVRDHYIATQLDYIFLIVQTDVKIQYHTTVVIYNTAESWSGKIYTNSIFEGIVPMEEWRGLFRIS
jgi:hypothetical protein